MSNPHHEPTRKDNPIGLCNKRQLASYLGLSSRSIENWMRRGQIPFIKVGRFVRFDPIEVRNALNRFRQENADLGGNADA